MQRPSRRRKREGRLHSRSTSLQSQPRTASPSRRLLGPCTGRGAPGKGATPSEGRARASRVLPRLASGLCPVGCSLTHARRSHRWRFRKRPGLVTVQTGPLGPRRVVKGGVTRRGTDAGQGEGGATRRSPAGGASCRSEGWRVLPERSVWGRSSPANAPCGQRCATGLGLRGTRRASRSRACCVSSLHFRPPLMAEVATHLPGAASTAGRGQRPARAETRSRFCVISD